MTDIICLARQTSSRFPNKIFATLHGKPVLQLIIDKLKTLNCRIIFAIPDNKKNVELRSFITDASLEFVGGPEEDVLARFLTAAKVADSRYVQRFNCDNVGFDVGYLAKCLQLVDQLEDYDLFSNIHCHNHSGQSVEIVSKSLCRIDSEPSPHEQEHVFPYFYSRSSRSYRLPCPSGFTTPLDTKQDLTALRDQMGD